MYLKWFFLILSTAYSLKCYNCVTSSEETCDRNQTLQECSNAQHQCATAMYTNVDNNGNFYSQTYNKRCLPLNFINNYCNIVNKSGLIHNCSISSCAEDYCNGPPPTTPTVPTVISTSPFEGTTQEPSTTEPKKEARSGSPSTNLTSSVFGLAMIALFSAGFWRFA